MPAPVSSTDLYRAELLRNRANDDNVRELNLRLDLERRERDAWTNRDYYDAARRDEDRRRDR